MKELKQTTKEFLENYVFNKTVYKSIDSNNVEQITNYIISEYINKLTTERDINHNKIDEELLKKADDALFDINSVY